MIPPPLSTACERAEAPGSAAGRRFMSSPEPHESTVVTRGEQLVATPPIEQRGSGSNNCHFLGSPIFPSDTPRGP